jgi:hypothetical protein
MGSGIAEINSKAENGEDAEKNADIAEPDTPETAKNEELSYNSSDETQ